MAETGKSFERDAIGGMPHREDKGSICNEPDGEVYRMDRRSRGICLIFVTTQFSTVLGVTKEEWRNQKRENEAKRIKGTFTELGFHCEVFVDLKRDEIMKKLKKYHNDEKLANSNCFVCWFLTGHDAEKRIYASDRQISLEDMTRLFLGDVCPALVGKPKLFFVQADYLTVPEKAALSDTSKIQRSASTIPICADILLGMHLAPKTALISGGHNDRSNYSETLCKILEQQNKLQTAYDITAVLNTVARQMSRDGCATASTCVSMLRRLLYLTKDTPPPVTPYL